MSRNCKLNKEGWIEKKKIGYCDFCKENRLYEKKRNKTPYDSLNPLILKKITKKLESEYNNRCFVCGYRSNGIYSHTKEHIYDKSCFKSYNKEMQICMHNLKLCCQGCNGAKNYLKIIEKSDGKIIDFNAIYNYNVMKDEQSKFDFEKKIIKYEIENEYLSIYQNDTFWKRTQIISEEWVFTDFFVNLHEAFITNEFVTKLVLEAMESKFSNKCQSFFEKYHSNPRCIDLITKISISLYMANCEFKNKIILNSIKKYLEELKEVK